MWDKAFETLKDYPRDNTNTTAWDSIWGNTFNILENPQQVIEQYQKDNQPVVVKQPTMWDNTFKNLNLPPTSEQRKTKNYNDWVKEYNETKKKYDELNNQLTSERKTNYSFELAPQKKQTTWWNQAIQNSVDKAVNKATGKEPQQSGGSGIIDMITMPSDYIAGNLNKEQEYKLKEIELNRLRSKLDNLAGLMKEYKNPTDPEKMPNTLQAFSEGTVNTLKTIPLAAKDWVLNNAGTIVSAPFSAIEKAVAIPNAITNAITGDNRDNQFSKMLEKGREHLEKERQDIAQEIEKLDAPSLSKKIVQTATHLALDWIPFSKYMQIGKEAISGSTAMQLITRGMGEVGKEALTDAMLMTLWNIKEDVLTGNITKDTIIKGASGALMGGMLPVVSKIKSPLLQATAGGGTFYGSTITQQILTDWANGNFDENDVAKYFTNEDALVSAGLGFMLQLQSMKNTKKALQKKTEREMIDIANEIRERANNADLNLDEATPLLMKLEMKMKEAGKSQEYIEDKIDKITKALHTIQKAKENGTFETIDFAKLGSPRNEIEVSKENIGDKNTQLIRTKMFENAEIENKGILNDLILAMKQTEGITTNLAKLEENTLGYSAESEGDIFDKDYSRENKNIRSAIHKGLARFQEGLENIFAHENFGHSLEKAAKDIENPNIFDDMIDKGNMTIEEKQDLLNKMDGYMQKYRADEYASIQKNYTPEAMPREILARIMEDYIQSPKTTKRRLPEFDTLVKKLRTNYKESYGKVFDALDELHNNFNKRYELISKHFEKTAQKAMIEKEMAKRKLKKDKGVKKVVQSVSEKIGSMFAKTEEVVYSYINERTIEEANRLMKEKGYSKRKAEKEAKKIVLKELDKNNPLNSIDEMFYAYSPKAVYDKYLHKLITKIKEEKISLNDLFIYMNARDEQARELFRLDIVDRDLNKIENQSVLTIFDLVKQGKIKDIPENIKKIILITKRNYAGAIRSKDAETAQLRLDLFKKYINDTLINEAPEVYNKYQQVLESFKRNYAKKMNALGLSYENADQIIATLKNKYNEKGIDFIGKVEKILDSLHELRQDYVVEHLQDVLKPDKFEFAKQNKYYMAHEVLDFIEHQMYGSKGAEGAGVDKMTSRTGTSLKDYTMSFEHLSDKDFRLRSIATANKAKRGVIDILKEMTYPDSDEPMAKRIPKGEKVYGEKGKYGVVKILEKGEYVDYLVPKQVADEFNNFKLGYNKVISAFNSINNVFKTLYTGVNLGFMIRNTFFRDPMRSAGNMKGISLLNYAKITAKNLNKIAKFVVKRGLEKIGIETNIKDTILQDIEDLARKSVISYGAERGGLGEYKHQFDLSGEIDYSKLTDEELAEIATNPQAFEKYIKKYNPEEAKQINQSKKILNKVSKSPKTLFKFTKAFVDRVEKINNFLDNLNKITGKEMLEAKGYKEDIGEINMLRKLRYEIGSPAFAIRGEWTPVLNNVFLYLNARVQGYRGDYKAMKERPMAWWANKIATQLVIKSLYIMAMKGMFGDDTKKMFDNINNYYKSSYNIIPISLLKTPMGKEATFALTLPNDQVDEAIGKVIWYGLNGSTNPADILKVADELFIPSLSPAIYIGKDIIDIAEGKAPIDHLTGKALWDERWTKLSFKEKIDKYLSYFKHRYLSDIAGLFPSNVYKDTLRENTKIGNVYKLPILGSAFRSITRIIDNGKSERMEKYIQQAKQEKRLKNKVKTNKESINDYLFNELSNMVKTGNIIPRDELRKKVYKEFGEMDKRSIDNVIKSVVAYTTMPQDLAKLKPESKSTQISAYKMYIDDELKYIDDKKKFIQETYNKLKIASMYRVVSPDLVKWLKKNYNQYLY